MGIDRPIAINHPQVGILIRVNLKFDPVFAGIGRVEFKSGSVEAGCSRACIHLGLNMRYTKIGNGEPLSPSDNG